MPKAAFKSPTIFVACPYSKKFGFERFKKYLESHYPGTIIFAETNLQTKHLLDILRGHIKKCDFNIFDVSTWNANVALELGLADGLSEEYFITLNGKQSSNVPSDIQGIQRIEYTGLEKGNQSLHSQFQRYIVKQKTFVGRKLWGLFKEEDRADALFTFAVRVICHFRGKDTLRPDTWKKLSGGLRLRDNHRQMVIDCLKKHKYIKSKGKNYTLARKVFKPYN